MTPTLPALHRTGLSSASRRSISCATSAGSAYAALVIHPVAFLIRDRSGRWGALDRRGEPLVDVVHSDEADVTNAIEGLLADTRPVL